MQTTATRSKRQSSRLSQLVEHEPWRNVPHAVEKAENSGSDLVQDIKLACEEPVIHGERVDLRFTFLFFVLRRRSNLA